MKKLNQGSKEWKEDEAAGGHIQTHACVCVPTAPIIPAPPRHRDCLGAGAAGGFPLPEDAPAPLIYTQAIPIQTLIKRIIPGCAEPEGRGARL